MAGNAFYLFIFIVGSRVVALVVDRDGSKLYFATAPKTIEVINVDGSDRKKLFDHNGMAVAVDLKKG